MLIIIVDVYRKDIDVTLNLILYWTFSSSKENNIINNKNKNNAVVHVRRGVYVSDNSGMLLD